MINVTVNGKARQFDGPLSVSALLEALDINARQVAVALNCEVVPRGDWQSVSV